MFPHKKFAQYCMQEIDSHNTGFLLPGGELLLRDKDNELTIYAVIARKRNRAVILSNAISAYKRSCEVVFNYLSLPTQISDAPTHWPEYKQSPSKRFASESDDEAVEIKRSKVDQNYRFRVDANRIAMFQATDRFLVEKFIVNIQKYAVVAWGMVEQLLERTRNPFRLIPLFTYGCTVSEWLSSALVGMDVSAMASSIGRYEECMCQEVLYREKQFVVAKRVGETPLVFLLAQPCTEAFMTALFFYLYAGGTKGTTLAIDASYLKFYLREPVVRPLICEEDKQLAANRYKRVLIDITDGRTQEEILSQFNTVEDLATHLVVEPTQLKFDIATVYVHPENQRVIKLANCLCRWTNLTVNPPARHYVKDARIRQSLILSSGEVEMDAIKALASEADLSIFQTLLVFSECPASFTDDELKSTFSDVVRNDRVHPKTLKEIVTKLELKQRCPDYAEIDNAIVYGAGKFHAEKSSSLLKSLNEEEQLLQMCDAPLVSNLFTVNLDLAPYLIKASRGKLALALQQAEVLQKNVDVLLKSILQDAFTTGPWKRLTAASSIAATLRAAFENKDTYWTEFREKSSSLVPFYLVKNTDLFIHYAKDHGCVVFQIKDDSVERRDDLASSCNDGTHLLNTPLASDGNLIAFILHLLYKTRRCDDLVRHCKQNVLLLASLYNISFTDTDGFVVFESGEDLLTHFMEKTFFSQTKTYDFSTAINVVDVIKEFAHEIEAVSTESSTLFVKNATPILYVFSGVNASEVLYSTLFDLWLASKNGNVGFLNFPSGIDSPHYLTLVYTPEIFNVLLPQPVSQYGTNIQHQKQHLSDTHRKLVKWAVDSDLTREDVSDVVSSHTSTLLRYRNSASNKRFSINYFNQTTINNTLSIFDDNIMKKLTPKREYYYASLQVSSQEFVLLFSQKLIK